MTIKILDNNLKQKLIEEEKIIVNKKYDTRRVVNETLKLYNILLK